jgi:hypothetical protein
VPSWVLLAYRLPREPSRPRLALWRALRRLGAVQVADGLVALPLTPETREHVEWLASGVVDDGGESSVWFAEAGTRDQDRRWRGRIRSASEAEYADLEARARAALALEPVEQRRARRTLRAELARAKARDYANASGSPDAAGAIEMLAKQATEVVKR